MNGQTSYPIWWNKEIVDFATEQEAAKILSDNPEAKMIEYKGKDGLQRKAILITTPVPKWRTINL